MSYQSMVKNWSEIATHLDSHVFALMHILLQERGIEEPTAEDYTNLITEVDEWLDSFKEAQQREASKMRHPSRSPRLAAYQE
ncbi:MAG TPA: hypothetical protein VFE45_06855 [Coriobacteriia bacterium]|nr:hypothetical protein [Coriobacteriia bacterium]